MGKILNNFAHTGYSRNDKVHKNSTSYTFLRSILPAVNRLGGCSKCHRSRYATYSILYYKKYTYMILGWTRRPELQKDRGVEFIMVDTRPYG